MFGRIWKILRRERLARSSAVIVSLVLIVVAHAPVLPVVAGCILAMSAIVIRGWHRTSKDVAVRGGR